MWIVRSFLGSFFLFFSLFALVICVSPNLSERTLAVTLYGLLLPWSVWQGFFTQQISELNPRAWFTHFSFYISCILLALIFYFYKEDSQILALSLSGMTVVLLSSRYLPKYALAVSAVWFFVMCYLSVNGFTLDMIMRWRLIGPVLFTFGLPFMLKGRLWASIVGLLSLILFLFIEDKTQYILLWCVISVVQYASFQVASRYRKHHELIFSVYYSVIFVLFLLYGNHLIQTFDGSL